MNKVLVVGAGASGIIAALKLSENNEVIVIEKNDKIGKKLLLTGSGRCNYWNDSIDKSKYNADDFDILENVLSYKEDTYNYLLSLGIYPKIKNGYYYPFSNQATSVQELFERKLMEKKVEIKYNTSLISIDKKDNEYIVNTTSGVIKTNKIILAMGGKSLAKTGSDGYIFELLKKHDIEIEKLTPALTPLTLDEDFLKIWNGVRCDGIVSLYNDFELIASEEGEIQFTDYGISGICVFNLSSKVIENKSILKINLMPYTNDYDSFIYNRVNIMNNPSLEDLFESLINYKLLYLIFKKVNINPKAHYNSLTDKEKDLLKKYLISFEVKVKDKMPFEKSQVTHGGVKLSEVNDNLELKKLPNVYVIGESLNVDGICGGYNLAFAFITGYIVGSRICTK